MKFIHKTIGVLAVGFLVLTFWSVLLYWPHKGCERGLMEITWASAGLGAFNSLQNKIRHPEVSDQMINELSIRSRITNLDFWGRLYGRSEPSPYAQMIALPEIYFDYTESDGRRTMVYFDDSLGLFIRCQISVRVENHAKKEIITYAGPQGMAKTPDKTLSRFYDFIPSSKMKTLDRLVVYDKKLHRFYRLNFNENRVRVSREYPPNSGYKPLGIDISGKRASNIEMSFDASTKDEIFRNTLYYDLQSSQFSLVLDQTGRIDWFDLDKMEFANKAGEVKNYDDVYSCRIVPLLWADSRKGLVVASAIIDSNTNVTQVVFDPDGQAVYSDEKTRSQWDLQDGSLLLVTKYLLENLYSPITLLGAYVQGVLFVTPDDQSSLYLPLNSFLVHEGREPFESYSKYIGHLFVIVTPALFLCSILAYYVSKNAVGIGLSKPACHAWRILVFAFGLPAYITWRIVRPKEVMVTCKNCGKLRRPDLETCQHCKSLWQVPEITPPNWRVVAPSEVGDPAAEAVAKEA